MSLLLHMYNKLTRSRKISLLVPYVYTTVSIPLSSSLYLIDYLSQEYIENPLNFLYKEAL
jgi:hypothetical protein